MIIYVWLIHSGNPRKGGEARATMVDENLIFSVQYSLRKIYPCSPCRNNEKGNFLSGILQELRIELGNFRIIGPYLTLKNFKT